MNAQATYIPIDDTRRIEVMPSGTHYPQRVVNSQFKESHPGWEWGYYRTGGFSSKARSFKTERGVRTFLAGASK